MSTALSAADKPDPRAILSAGYSPIPLPRGAKWPPLEGWTGARAPMASGADVEAWIESGAYGNVAVRLPAGVIGVDVDAYGDKQGGQTWLELTGAEWPLTHVVTARDDGVSGIRLYRLPEGFDESQLFGTHKHVDIIKHSHRYIVGPGSINPETGTAYGSLDQLTGEVSLTLPDARKLPQLTAEQAERLTEREHWTWPPVKPEGAACVHVTTALAKAISELAVGQGRHDAMTRNVLNMVRLEESGHPGATITLGTLEAVYLHELSKAPRAGESPADVRQEFARAVQGAREVVARKPTLEGDKGCGVVHVEEPEEAVSVPRLPLSFWSERASLQHVRQAARSRALGPDGLLLTCLVRVACSLDATWVLPPIVGSEASTNLFGALVMGSGGGKSAARGVAAELVPLVAPLPAEWSDADHPDRGTVKEITMGTGEGMVEALGTKEGKTWLKGEHALLIDSDEVDAFMGQAGLGASTTATLRTAWSGGRLGATQRNAPTAVARLDYRLGLLVGAQPERCTNLLTGKEAHAGTPQRFVWLTALVDDDLAADSIPDWPGQLEWGQWVPGRSCQIEPVTPIINSHGQEVQLAGVPVPQSVVTEVRQDHLKQAKSLSGTLDGHRNLARLKLALALGLLERGSKPPKITVDDWRLAGVVLETSDGVREWIAEQAGKAQVSAAVETITVRRSAEQEAEHAIERIAGRLERAMAKHGSQSTSELRRALESRDRRWLDDGLMRLQIQGRAVQTGKRWALTER